MGTEDIKSESDLRAAIVQLESTQAVEGKILKEQFHEAYQSMKPINILKSTFQDVTESPEIKNSLLNTSVDLVAGYVSKKAFEDVSNAPLRKLLGTALMFGITTTVAKNPVAVRAVGLGLMKLISGGIQATSVQNKPK